MQQRTKTGKYLTIQNVTFKLASTDDSMLWQTYWTLLLTRTGLKLIYKANLTISYIFRILSIWGRKKGWPLANQLPIINIYRYQHGKFGKVDKWSTGRYGNHRLSHLPQLPSPIIPLCRNQTHWWSPCCSCLPLASSEPEAISFGSIRLKSTLQHLFSCSWKDRQADR